MNDSDNRKNQPDQEAKKPTMVACKHDCGSQFPANDTGKYHCSRHERTCPYNELHQTQEDFDTKFYFCKYNCGSEFIYSDEGLARCFDHEDTCRGRWK